MQRYGELVESGSLIVVTRNVRDFRADGRPGPGPLERSLTERSPTAAPSPSSPCDEDSILAADTSAGRVPALTLALALPAGFVTAGRVDLIERAAAAGADVAVDGAHA